ncbi:MULTISPECIES: tRNA (cytosine(32)/uridine(32)-2'-O)-methyltransferase TrmJ [unclassified Arsukibacterium]|uniref:tRNA (cytosine(32)/uridine(32)-2'-O)-methyltransferase TrmJ n=1 Tax=unclassified Arsukibacterium TaxID=2635278 RepID=UPI000C63151F|nr:MULTISPECIES: tRNA (cytosine(32)/uridine(32)-2'-O)-methyltransferase TrmJ [unclassified Arsukibacterium]MAA96025.1 tRNA (cytosine(32)/uridine(32)-2'-O)-methyltransferase TrmJ [Rheinheimera sp.]MBM34320.1 tRNA (cytosine(32)/uridine(32)-2'-O)-methyltransferase TrmJ [Rheinheimera sp.]HAW92293.1 tRNA (cytosine(32)/uridine(32)-2'-O)-methyltransferase TrmJ [Candidatus Azambacteria bacterium]|tara:strand:+ start:34037 stop:34813 length:777 start_codon:yes stop_codon:yes gene_type:complete
MDSFSVDSNVASALDNIKVVLVGTTHTGNIGSVARAMKTMGLSQLCLVAPKTAPDGQAYALAAGASDILASATTFDSLAEAVADCALVVGSSARSRTLSWPMLEPRECAQLAVAQSKQPVAVVFGRESSGLSNEELQLCNYHVCIAANPQYSSLNLAMAVQIVCYELRMAYLEHQSVSPDTELTAYPSSAQMENFYQHLEVALQHTGFIIKQHPGVVMTKLKRLFNRARPEEAEYNILRGILTSMQRLEKLDSNTHKE